MISLTLMSLDFRMMTQAFMGHKSCTEFKLKQRLIRIIWLVVKTIVLQNATDTKKWATSKRQK